MDFLNNIPIQTTTGFIGLGLLVFGGFMILAGLDIISIEKISVRQGRRTWILGLAFAALGLFLLFPEISISSSGGKPASDDDQEAGASASLVEPAPLEFLFSSTQLWKESPPGVFTASGSEDTFAWSKDIYQGDLELALELTSSQPKAEGCVILFGSGQGYTPGSLLFCVNVDGYYLEKNTIYHQGENYLTYTLTPVDLQDAVYSLVIEVKDDLASLSVNGEQVYSAFFDTEEINPSGRIGLLKKWFYPEITFSNLSLTRPIPAE